MVLALAVLAALFSAATALASVLSRREAVQEAAALRRQLLALGQRLEAAERAAERAAGRAEAASRLLLEKGIASEGELEGVHEPAGPPEAPAPRSRTVH